MPKKLNFESLQDFFDHNEDEIWENYFTYYHLIKSVSLLEQGRMELFEAYNVTDQDGSKVLGILITGHYFLYSSKWNDEVLNFLCDEIETAKYPHFNFLGRKELILELLEKQKGSYEILKDRIVYECSAVDENVLLNEAYNSENASIQDFEELVQMSRDNYDEEYQGKGQTGVEQTQAGVLNGIQHNRLFLLRDEEEICSIVQVVNEEQSLPMIGNLFTKQSKRNKGCALNLLHIVTKGFLNNGAEKCGLVSDVTNPASNKVFLKVGYVSVYNWAIIFKY